MITPTLIEATDGASAQLPFTSLILSSRNRPSLLAESIASILQGNCVPTELIIVDQSDAPDMTLSNLKTHRPCDIRYLWTRLVGLSRANNLGIEAARFELLIFTHDDVTILPTWFEALVAAALTAGPHGVVTGRVLPAASATPDGFAPSTKVDETPAVYTRPGYKDVLYPLNMAMYRSALVEVGGFDERLGPGTPFPGSEDSDLGYRLLRAGYSIHYVPQAALYHRAWRSDRDYLPLRWSYGVARGAYYAKYLNWSDNYMVKRLGAEVARLGGLPDQLWHNRRQAQGDVVLIAGVLFGLVRWILTYGKSPVSPTRQSKRPDKPI